MCIICEDLAIRQAEILRRAEGWPTPADLIPAAFRAEVEAEVAVDVERQLLGDITSWKPMGLGPLLDAMKAGNRPIIAGSLEMSASFDIEWLGSDADIARLFGPVAGEPDEVAS